MSEKKPSTKRKPKTTDHVLIRRTKISGKWKEVGEKVSLTEIGYKYFKSEKRVK